MGGDFSYGNSFDGLLTTTFDLSGLPPAPGDAGWTPEMQQKLEEDLKQIDLTPVPPPTTIPAPPPIDMWDQWKQLGFSDYEINQAYRGSDQYRETVFDKMWSSGTGVTPYHLMPNNKNIESYVVFFEGDTKYYTGSENIDEFRRLGYTVQRNPDTYEWTALLYKEQLQNDLPPTQYIPSVEVPWTEDLGRDPVKNIPREVETPVPPPIVPPPPLPPLDDETAAVTPTPNYTPLYVLGGALALYVLTRK